MSCSRFRFLCIVRSTLSFVAVLVSSNALAQSPQEQLFMSVVAGADCKQSSNNGLICEYKVGQKLRFSIKDAGGSDEVIAFRHSDWDDDYYAVMYFDCVAVIPGKANPKKYDKEDGAFVSPKNGRVYHSRFECQAANK